MSRSPPYLRLGTSTAFSRDREAQASQPSCRLAVGRRPICNLASDPWAPLSRTRLAVASRTLILSIVENVFLFCCFSTTLCIIPSRMLNGLLFVMESGVPPGPTLMLAVILPVSGTA